MGTYSSIVAWSIPWTEAWQVTVHGVAKGQTYHCLHVLSDKESKVRKGRGRGGRPSGKLPEMERRCKTGPVQADFCFLSFPNVLPKVNHQWLMGLAYSSKADLSW